MSKTYIAERKQIPLDNGYTKGSECISLFTIGQLTCLPSCNEEE
ncbi:putative DNA-directed RNA polymerase [Daphnia magna]|uniref:Putative DNA-directed RNA polymerase n=1 Tax=Daphnia magna TaxID=35525 RepID=A0A162EZY6_9CRUS|nr:putative DNA-directed RNA polymerase [Daphnia magna]